ncbi:hypothetical protein BABINDRAFT_87820 [Babjeviella inositovora NRRL Y-12698]|uniref:LisH domain-containing protein n=1 Tax=Babjeviella inositovora NRRL Y-12698 TaxID=984486 RepID=A0A1E3QKE0_9ASCO|nr:uncharacterized protein BABINDRAFT_87820 [Babjeviella inositovora NRRL Y-12698]ODQ78153.1 hypothetical protein BABINDRAFT_87820 [Babjeviella inositovora NRRL Y-12698]
MAPIDSPGDMTSASTPPHVTPSAYASFDKNQLSRILYQALNELGFPEAASHLRDEAGLCLDAESRVDQVIQSVLAGQYENALICASGIDYVGYSDDEPYQASNETLTAYVRFLIHRMHFLEVLLHEKRETVALKILRKEISPSKLSVPIPHTPSTAISDETAGLASLLMNPSSAQLQAQNGWVSCGEKSLQTTREATVSAILGFVKPEDKLPAGMLPTLLTQALKWKRAQHFTLHPPPALDKRAHGTHSLYSPETPKAQQFPATAKVTLKHHTDEVWFVKFSPSGRYLASAGLDAHIIIYDVMHDFKVVARISNEQHANELAGSADTQTNDTEELSSLGEHWASQAFHPVPSRWPSTAGIQRAGNTHHTSDSAPAHNKKAVMCVSWSYDEKYLLTCGMEACAKLWDVSALGRHPVRCIKEFHINPNGRIFIVEFLPLDPTYHFAIASPDKVTRLYSILSTEPVYEWSNEQRIDDISFCKDGSHLAMITHDFKLFVYGINKAALSSGLPCTAESFPLVACIPIGHKITSVVWSAVNPAEILVSVSPNELQLWSIKEPAMPYLVQRYLGHRHERYVLHSSFGNWDESVVVSGDEKGRIFFWDRYNGSIVHIVNEQEHQSLLVNCVDWNVAGSEKEHGWLWCSAGDDGTVKLWGV